jgi:hypothetical protein
MRRGKKSTLRSSKGRVRHSLLNGFFREMHNALQELILAYKDFRDVTLYFKGLILYLTYML